MLNLNPPPKNIRKKRGTLILPRRLPLVLESADSEEILRKIKLINKHLRGITQIIPYTAGKTGNPALEIKTNRKPRKHNLKNPESYSLSIDSKRIVLESLTEKGIFLGLQTLLQIIHSCGKQLPQLSLTDWPDFPWRGVHLYLGGPGETNHTIDLRLLPEIIIDKIVRQKFNLVILEVNHQLRFESHPELSGKYSFSKKKLDSLVRLAREHNLKVIPQLQSLGHISGFLKRRPELAEDKALLWSYCISNPKTRKVWEDLYAEICELIQPEYFHIGHDEVDKIGICPRCRGKEQHLLFAQDIIRTHDFLEKRGIRTLMWGDMLLNHEFFPKSSYCFGGRVDTYPGKDYLRWSPLTWKAIDLIPKDIIICDWHYWEKDSYTTLRYFQDKGFEVLGAPWYNPKNIKEFSCSAYRSRSKRLLGMLETAWVPASKVKADPKISRAIDLSARCFWNAKS